MITGRTEPGTRVGRYRLVERIGLGGMAEVFRARHEGEGGFTKELVIKMILPAYAEDENFIEMFMSEAKLAARLDHSNIVHVFDFGSEDGRHFLAMELVRGLTLRSVREKCRDLGTVTPVDTLARIACGLCAGLHYAHELSDEKGRPLEIVHRDVSPENIIVGWDGQPKLLDFGIAKATTADSTASGILKGKYSYLAPEQVLGHKDLDRRTDIYAVGVLMYEALSGIKPFSRPDNRIFQILEDIVERDPPPLALFRNIPQPVIAIVNKAMAKKREDRYQTAQQMRTDIERFLARLDHPVLEYHVAQYLETLASGVAGPEQTREMRRGENSDEVFIDDASTEYDLTYDERELDRMVIAGTPVKRRDDDTKKMTPDWTDDATREYARTADGQVDSPAVAAELARATADDAPTKEVNLYAGGVAKMVRNMQGGREITQSTAQFGTRIATVLESDMTYDDVAADLLNRIDEGVPAGEPHTMRTRRRIGTLIDRANIACNVGDYARAVIATELAFQEAPKSATGRKALAERSAQLEHVFMLFLGDLGRSPRLAVPMSELVLHDIDHRIGYLLSRIDGKTTLEEILSISGMSQEEACRHLCWMLLEQILVVDGGQSVSV